MGLGSAGVSRSVPETSELGGLDEWGVAERGTVENRKNGQRTTP
jgi:hypothetical protein